MQCTQKIRVLALKSGNLSLNFCEIGWCPAQPLLVQMCPVCVNGSLIHVGFRTLNFTRTSSSFSWLFLISMWVATLAVSCTLSLHEVPCTFHALWLWWFLFSSTLWQLTPRKSCQCQVSFIFIFYFHSVGDTIKITSSYPSCNHSMPIFTACLFNIG